ncbi:MAG TPA: hypothetical protein VJC16_05470 [Candidatus Nanoarchaeia archaeon]|nr:hypothetical protein [Candidatus Nanoarchaeia archaeon]
MAKDEQYEDLIKDFLKHKKLYKKSQRLISTTDREHRRAYDSAAELIVDEEGLIDYEKLDDADMQLKFADKMADHYLSKAKQHLKSKASGEDEFENEMLRKAYSGTTRAELRQYVGQLGKKFTFDEFNSHHIKGNFMREIIKTLSGAAASHIKEKHIPHIVKYTKSGEFLDPSKMRLEDAINLLTKYHAEGPLSPDDYSNVPYRNPEHYKKHRASSH